MIRPLTLLIAIIIAALAVRPAFAADQQPIHIELALQEGGEGTDIFRQIVSAFEASHSDIKVDIDSDPRIGDKLHLRILEKSFPEITNGDFGGWNLIRHGDVLPLNEKLAMPPSATSNSTWRDCFLPGTLDRYSENGQVFAIPLSYYVQSIWFNHAMFREHGWNPPKTWPQLLALCQTIKDQGISPFAFQGRYPYYGQMFVDGAYYESAGADAYLAQKQLEPGSFNNPEMIQALAWTQTLAKSYFQPGAMGMGHTEAQLQFFLGHTAMIPCGSWLKSEMAGKIPDGFELGSFNLPSVPGGKGDPTALLATSGYFVVFAHSKHPTEATEFLRFMTSPKMAALFCRQRDIPVAVRGVNERNLSNDLADLAAMIRNSRESYGSAPGEGFATMDQASSDQLLAVLTGDETPTEAAARLESAAALARQTKLDPETLPITHVIKPLILLALLIAGAVYAAWNQFKRGPQGKRIVVTTQPQRILSTRNALLFVGPSAAMFLFFVLLPALKSFSWSVQKWDGLTGAQFIGLRHFRYLLFSSDGFWTALENNLYIMFVIPLLMVPLSLFLAACVSRGVRGTNFFRGAFLLPSVIGGVSATLLWMQLYDPQAGIANAGLVSIGTILTNVGLHSIGAWFQGFNGFAWLSQAHLYTSIVPMSVWAGFGFNFVLYLAAMEAVPPELYEAAELDGASPLQQFFTVNDSAYLGGTQHLSGLHGNRRNEGLRKHLAAHQSAAQFLGPRHRDQDDAIADHGDERRPGSGHRGAAVRHGVRRQHCGDATDAARNGGAVSAPLASTLEVEQTDADSIFAAASARVRADRTAKTNITARPSRLKILRSTALRAIVYLILLLVLLTVLYPLFWLITASLKTDRAMFAHPFAMPELHNLQWINFTRAWSVGHFHSYFVNSIVVTAFTVIITTLLSAMAAYALCRFTFLGARPIFFLLLAGLMLPLQQVVVPLFFEMRELGLLNSRLGLIIVYIALGLPFGVFVMSGFFKTQPASVYESALVDGAGEWRAFWSIMLPIARPGLITVAIFTFLGTWNEFMVAFMFLSGQGSETLRTLPLGLANITIAGQYRSDWGQAFAGLVLIVAPTLIICLTLQRYITKGLTAGAVKG